MQRVTVLCVGKLKEKFYLEAAAEYVKRLQRFCKLELVELPESRLPADGLRDPMFQILRQGGRRRKGHQRLLRLRRGIVRPGLHGGGRPESAGLHAHAQRGRRVNRKEHPSCLICRNMKSGWHPLP